MEKMKKAQKGKTKRRSKTRWPAKLGLPGMSKELAKMAAQQALRNMVREYEEGLKNKPARKPALSADLSKLMEQTETDLVNKKLSLKL